MEDEQLAALADAQRWRIVGLLAERPRPVGEVAELVGLRQPQATKHLQTLARAGLVLAYPLGRRRIYALDRDAFGRLGAHLTSLATDTTADHALVEYAAAVATTGTPNRADRTIRKQRIVPAAPRWVFAAWTTSRLARRWWAPEGLTVARFHGTPRAGARLRLDLTEGDGRRHVAIGEYLEVDEPSLLRFRLDPVDEQGTPYFRTTMRVRLTPHRRGTQLRLTIQVGDVSADAGAVLAGMNIGWRQTLDNLVALAARQASSDHAASAT